VDTILDKIFRIRNQYEFSAITFSPEVEYSHV